MSRFGGGKIEPMPKLEVEKKIVRKVDYADFERFLEQFFGLDDVSLIAEFEWHNDSMYTVYVNGVDFEDLDDEFGEGTYEALAALREGKKVDKLPSVQAMIECAASCGLIEKGDYTVEVYY